MAHREIIVIGGSAGSIEALRPILAGLPADLPAAVLVVVHIPTHAPTHLHEILDRAGPLPAVPAQDGQQIVPGKVYVAVTDRHLMVDGKKIRLPRGPKENRFRPAIDVLFRSAAHAYGSRVVGTILSGMLDDGTAGLWAIKDRNGLSVIQSREEVRCSSMVDSAAQHVAIDHEARIAEMPSLLSRLVREPLHTVDAVASEALTMENSIAVEGNALKRGVMKLGALSANTCPECHGVLVKITNGSILRFRCHTGHAYSMETLLADVGEEIDATLWGAVRAIEERALLLRELETLARDAGHGANAQGYARRASAAERRAQHVRETVVGDE